MKKIKFISAIALTMVLASCENFDLPNPPGQTNPEPGPVFENSGLVLAQEATTANLVEANEQNVFVNVAKVTELVNFPADYDLSVDMEVSGDENFGDVTTIATVITDNMVTVNPDVLNGAIEEVMTKKPGTYDIYARYAAYAQRNDTRVRLGGLDAYYGGTMKYNITTLNPAKVIEDAYYLVPCDASGKPELGKKVLMNNTSGSSVSPYDNPEFAIKIDVPDTDLSWKLMSQSAVTAGDLNQAYGCIAAEGGLSGKLSQGAEAGVISLHGPVLVTVNVEVDSYSINYALDNLWPLSGMTVVTPANALLLYTDNFINYSGVTVLGKNWTLAGQPNSKGDVIFTLNEELGFTDSEDGLTRTGFLLNSKDGAGLQSPVSGSKLYWLDVNLVQLTYTQSCLKTLSVIGSGNDWTLETATELKPSKDFKTWTAENVVVGDEFKINANGAWTIGFSGTQIPDATGKQVYQVNKQDGGANLQAKPGTYKVTVDFSNFPYTVTLE